MDATTSPTDSNYFADHSSEALRSIVVRYTADALFMDLTSPALAAEARKVAENAKAELLRRSQ